MGGRTKAIAVAGVPPARLFGAMLHRHSKLDFARSIHFVTIVTAERGQWFIDSKRCRELLLLFEGYRAKSGLHCLAYVLMPDHLHALLFQETEGDHVSVLMQRFKRMSVKHKPSLYTAATFWRRHYDDVPVPGSQAARTKVNYVHANPVRKGMVSNEVEYEWSSARDWAGLGEGIVKVSKELLSFE